MTRISLVQSLTGHQDRGESLPLPVSLLLWIRSSRFGSLSLFVAWSLDWSPSEPVLASCSSDKSIRLYSFLPPTQPSPNQFQLSSTIPTSHIRTVRNLSFSPTGTTLATASFDSTVGIWCKVNEAGLDDVQGGGEQDGSGRGEWEPVDPLEGHESECKGVAWSTDGRLLASCSRDKSVWVWEGKDTPLSPRILSRSCSRTLIRQPLDLQNSSV